MTNSLCLRIFLVLRLPMPRTCSEGGSIWATGLPYQVSSPAAGVSLRLMEMGRVRVSAVRHTLN
jgi:hypothetical protein